MNASPALDAALDALHDAPLEAFVDERKRLARELRGDGDRTGAAELAKARKPSAAAWALNRAARDTPDLVSEWLTVSADLREASARPAQAGAGLRAAIAAHRSTTSRLMESIRERARPGDRPLSEDMVDRVRNLLQAATIDPDAAERLRRGRVSEDAGASAPEPRPVAVPADEPPAPQAGPAPRDDAKAARRAAAQARREQDEQRRRAERIAEHERRIDEARAEERRRAAEHAQRRGEAGEADQRLAAARRALDEAETRAQAAREAAEAAAASLSAAQERTAELRAEAPSGDG